MSFAERMRAEVGDTNSVARYLVEKMGHAALIAWCLAKFTAVDPVAGALWPAVLYVVVGKVIWFALLQSGPVQLPV